MPTIVPADGPPAAGGLRRLNRQERADIRHQRLLCQLEPPVVTVTLDRPAASNRVDPVMAAELREVCAAIAGDPEICAVILTGGGGAFSAGREVLPAERPADLAAWIGGLQAASWIARLPAPVIAAVNGDALDHGLELALAADVRIAAPEARFGLTDVTKGVLPWDGGTLRLPRVVGPAWAADMVLTGRVLCAGEALSIGLVNRIAPDGHLIDEAHALASEVAAGAPLAARYAKEALTAGMELSLEQGLRLEADLNILLHTTADRAEGIRSFLERRKPQYTGC